MTSPLPSGPGMLAAYSRLAQPDKCPPEQYETWYFEDHIPDVLNTSGITRALFYTNTDPKAERPYLALYPLKDLLFLQSNEFIKNIRVTSPLLPEGEDGSEGLCYDYMDVDVAYLQHVQTYEPKQDNAAANGDGAGVPPTGLSKAVSFSYRSMSNEVAGPAKCVIRAAIEPGPNTSDEDFDRWYREEVLSLWSPSPVTPFLLTPRLSTMKPFPGHLATSARRASKWLSLARTSCREC